MANEKKEKGSFFSNILSSIFGSSDAEAEKKRQLKALAKKLSKSRYNKFYKYSGNEILPPLGKLFYELYKALAPLQAMFHTIQNQNALKSYVVDYSMPEELKTIEESLSEEKILSMSKQIPVEKLKEQVEERLSKFSDYFTLERITEIDALYRQILALKAVSTFDYYFFLKKFDKTIKENSFAAQPHFEHVNAEYISDDLKDYIEAIWDVPFDSDWTNAFKFLKSVRGSEPISINTWKKVMTRLSSLKTNQTFEMIIQLASSNPAYVPNVQSLTSNIVEPYIDKIKNDVETVINSIIEKQRSDTESNFVSQLFGDTEITMLANYSDAKNSIFEHKGLNVYDNTQSLSYLKAFLLEVIKKDIREFYDVVLVRGTWDSQTLTTQISDCYNELLSTSEKISTFDAEMADDGPIGIKIKTLLPKTERDNSSRNIVNRLISEANETAYSFVMTSTKDILTIGRIIKTLVEDLQKPKPIIISNYKELEHYLDLPLKEFCVSIYKKIFYFTSLIKTCLVKPEGEE